MLTAVRRPRSIAAQLILLVTASAVIFHACVALAVYVAHGVAPVPAADVDMIADVVNALDTLPSDRRARYLDKLQAIHADLVIGLAASDPREARPIDSVLAGRLAPLLPERSSVVSTSGGRLAIATPGGLHIEALFPKPKIERPPFGNIIFGTLLFVASSVTLFLLWAIRTITRPLGAFAKAVDRFALDRRNELLAESGSLELRTASRAFNRMQLRIQTMMDERTRMLASIGHDLRTPITRIRLRAEFIGEEKIRGSIVNDLKHMDSMVHSALSFLRDEAATPPRTRIDLASLLQTVCDEFADIGHTVTYSGPDHLIIEANVDDLRRGVTNLVNNAVFHAPTVAIDLCSADSGWIHIDVADDGPGIADADKDLVFQPFSRGHAARSDASGFGLGLPSVRTIAVAHGGSVTLHDRVGGGLISRIRLPRHGLRGAH